VRVHHITGTLQDGTELKIIDGTVGRGLMFRAIEEDDAAFPYGGIELQAFVLVDPQGDEAARAAVTVSGAVIAGLVGLRLPPVGLALLIGEVAFGLTVGGITNKINAHIADDHEIHKTGPLQRMALNIDQENGRISIANKKWSESKTLRSNTTLGQPGVVAPLAPTWLLKGPSSRVVTESIAIDVSISVT
jgi:hypothetical protein